MSFSFCRTPWRRTRNMRSFPVWKFWSHVNTYIESHPYGLHCRKGKYFVPFMCINCNKYILIWFYATFWRRWWKMKNCFEIWIIYMFFFFSTKLGEAFLTHNQEKLVEMRKWWNVFVFCVIHSYFFFLGVKFIKSAIVSKQMGIFSWF